MSTGDSKQSMMLDAVDILGEAVELCQALDLALEAQGGEHEGPLCRLLLVIEQKVEEARTLIDDVRLGGAS